MYRFIFILLISLTICFAIPLQNRFFVPIYFSSSLTYGYDSNILKFSDEEKLDSEIQPWLLDENSLTSSMVKGSVSIQYIPYLIDGYETKINTKISYANFLESDDKKYFGYSFKISQKLGPYNWIRISYSLLPDLYLREYIDRDTPVFYSSNPLIDFNASSVNEFYDSSFFSDEKIALNYTHPLPFSRSNVSMTYSSNKQFYNKYFTEFDLIITEYKGGIYLRNIPGLKLSMSYAKSNANNLTHKDGNIATELKDRGFKQDKLRFGIVLDQKFNYFFDSMGLYANIEKREFTSLLDTDPLHFGRSHTDTKYTIWFKEKLSSTLNIKIAASHRDRITISSEDFVESLKSFKKMEFFVTFIYISNLNLYY